VSGMVANISHSSASCDDKDSPSMVRQSVSQSASQSVSLSDSQSVWLAASQSVSQSVSVSICKVEWRTLGGGVSSITGLHVS
jgi:hypothetical protein